MTQKNFQNSQLEATQSKKIGWIIVWIVAILMVLLSLSFVSAWSSNQFNNSLTSENLMFTGNQNITRYLSIPNSVSFLTKGYLNLSGLDYQNYVSGAYYNFDENSGTSAINTGTYSGGSYPITITNEGMWNNTLARINTSLYFNGSNYGSFSQNSWNAVGNLLTGTFELWIYPTEFKNNYNYIYNHDNLFGGSAGCIYINKSGTLFSGCLKFQDNIMISNTSINLNEWSHIAMTWTYNGAIELFINGNKVYNSTDNAFREGLASIDYLGINNNNNTQSFIGFMDDLRLWQSVRTQSEIKLDAFAFSNINNPFLLIKSQQVWNYSGQFNQTNNKTNNLASYINQYLNSTYLVGSNYLIPFIFHSDTAGVLQYLGLIFNNEGVIEDNQTFNSSTYETSLESFLLNLTYDSNNYEISANLVYNGTSYLGTKIGSGNNVLFSKTLNIPLISGTQQNISFHWQIALTNELGTYYYNSTFQNQTVNAISLGECSGTTTIKTLNITAWYEQSLTRFNPFDLKGTLTYSTSIGGLQKSYSFINTNIAEKSVCINLNTTFYLNGLLEYSNTSYQTKNYYFLDYPINNITKNLNLYMLPLTSSTSFIIQVQDTNILPLANYYVSIFRYNAGNATPYLVQVIKTDINGQGISFLETETVDYLFEVFDTNGNMVYISGKQRAIPQLTPYTITLTVGAEIPSPLIYLANLTGLTYSLAYDKSTFKITYIYTDTNTSFSLASLNIYKNNLSGLDELIYSSSKTDASGVIIADLTGNSTGSYYAVASIFRNSQQYTNRINFEIEIFSQTAGLLGVMGGFFIILIAAFMFAYNEVAGIISVVVAIIAVNLIGFVHFGVIFITAIIALSIILLIILERG